MSFVNENYEGRKWRTIDHERNIALYQIHGSRPEEGYEFELNINGQAIIFSAFSDERIHGHPKLGEKRQYEMNWRIYQISIPSECDLPADNILQLIKEALVTWGWNFSTEYAASVSLKINDHARGAMR